MAGKRGKTLLEIYTCANIGTNIYTQIVYIVRINGETR
jgi:hypothetical protein